MPTRKKHFEFGLGLLLVGIAQPALAQSAPPTDPASATTSGDDDIVVTATKRSERLSDVPIAVTALDSAALKESGAVNIVQLQGLVPSVFVQSDRGYGAAGITIRGTSGNQAFLQDDPVAVYIDGIYQPATGFFGTLGLTDLGSVEVVRGPQGTLQGRNATAGALLIRTADPTSEFQGSVSLRGADPTEYRAQLVASGPVSSTLSARIAVDRFDQRGWGKNVTLDRRVGGEQGVTARSVLLWKPTSRARLRASVNYTYITSQQALVRWAATTINPTGQAVTAPTPGTPLPQAQRDRVLKDGIFDFDTPTFSTTRAFNVALEGSVDFDHFSLIALVGANTNLTTGQADSDGLVISGGRGGFNTGRSENNSVSGELRLQSPDSGRLLWMVGVYGSAATQRVNFNINNINFTTPIRTLAAFTARQTNPSFAVFTDETFRITDQLSIIGGVRYSTETKNFANLFQVTNLINGATLSSVPTPRTSKSFEDVSYRVKVTYKPSRDILFYGGYSKGFKSGGFNAFATGGASSKPYEPEKLYSYEVGLKADLFDRVVSFGLAGFYNDYKNLQVTIGVPTGGVAIQNAAAARIKGIEFEGTLRPAPGLTLNGNLSYLDTHYIDFRNVQDLSGAFVDASGGKLVNAPKFQYFVQARYAAAVSGNWRVEGLVNYRWRDKVYFTPYSQTFATLVGPSLGELGARLNFVDTRDGLSVALFGTNLLDKRAYSSLQLTFSYPMAAFNRPRVLGIELEKKF